MILWYVYNTYIYVYKIDYKYIYIYVFSLQYLISLRVTKGNMEIEVPDLVRKRWSASDWDGDSSRQGKHQEIWTSLNQLNTKYFKYLQNALSVSLFAGGAFPFDSQHQGAKDCMVGRKLQSALLALMRQDSLVLPHPCALFHLCGADWFVAQAWKQRQAQTDFQIPGLLAKQRKTTRKKHGKQSRYLSMSACKAFAPIYSWYLTILRSASLDVFLWGYGCMPCWRIAYLQYCNRRHNGIPCSI